MRYSFSLVKKRFVYIFILLTRVRFLVFSMNICNVSISFPHPRPCFPPSAAVRFPPSATMFSPIGDRTALNKGHTGDRCPHFVVQMLAVSIEERSTHRQRRRSEPHK